MRAATEHKKTPNEVIIDRLFEQIEKSGRLPWQRGRESDCRLPYNFKSGNTYQGRNLLLLMAANYVHSGYLTYKQAKELGYQVRHGESGWPILYAARAGFVDVEITDARGQRATIQKYVRGGGKLYYVFNVSQIDGVPELSAETAGSNADVEQFLANLPVKWKRGRNPCYYPLDDAIGVPYVGDYASDEHYYSEMFHELIHWTGHPSRCNRAGSTDKHSDEYAIEECVAEIGSAFLRGRFGIQSPDVDANNAAYVQSWLEAFRERRSALLAAAADAQKAVEYLLKIGTPQSAASPLSSEPAGSASGSCVIQ